MIVLVLVYYLGVRLNIINAVVRTNVTTSIKIKGFVASEPQFPQLPQRTIQLKKVKSVP